MAFDTQLLVKVLSPKVASKAVQTFDRATTIVVGVCWGAAVFMMALAIYTTMMSVSARKAAENAIVNDPVLPKIVHKNIESKSAQQMVERLQRRYPEVIFSLGNNQSLTITAVDGGKFRQWLTALSYIDTISPEYHWSLTTFCVGKCPGNELMRAVLSGERISFEAPQL